MTVMRFDAEIGRFFWIKPRSHSVKPGDMAGHLHHTGYRVVMIDYKKYQEHVLVWLWYHGKFHDGEIDHINHNRSDNRIKNLRVVSNQENQQNRRRQNNNSSGVTGVSWNSQTGKWYAYIKKANKEKHLGTFGDYFEAICARKSADLQYGFHPNHGKQNGI